MEELQRCWVIPCIGQYISLFRSAFSLPEIDIQELEEGLVENGISNGNTFLPSLFISLLHGFFPSRVSLTNWETFLRRILERYWVKREKRENPFDKVASFSQLPLNTKVEILYCLCLYRLDCDDVAKAMKSMDAEALRVQSLGSDEDGNVYWYFYGTRLYKEAAAKHEKKGSRKLKLPPPPRGRGRPRKIKPVESDNDSDDFKEPDSSRNCLILDSKTRWSVVCTTLEDWIVFAQKFKASKSDRELALYQLVMKNFIPVLSKMYEKKEEITKRKITASNRSPPKIVNKKTNKKNEAKRLVKKPEMSLKRKRSSSSDERLEKKTRELGEKNFMESVTCGKDFAKGATPSVSVHNDKFIDRNLSYEPGLMMQLLQVLTTVKHHKDAWPFRYPVDEATVPDYYDVIKEPISLLDIERKIALKAYRNLGQIEGDFLKLVSNCQLYNGENDALTSMAKTLWRVFRKGITQMIEALENDVTHKAAKVNEETRPNTSSSTLPTFLQKPNKQKKGKHSQTMLGLDVLAEASEQALKDVGTTEGELFVVDTPEIPLKSKAFPDLSVITIQNHPPSFVEKCKRSSTSSRDSSDSDAGLQNPSSPASTSGQGSEDHIERRPRKKKRASFPRKVKMSPVLDASVEEEEERKGEEVEEENLNLSIEKPISPDSCNNVMPRNLSPFGNLSNERLSNNESSQGSLRSLQDFGENCPILDIPAEVTKGESICNNLSSLLSRIIKENQVFQMSDSQQLLYTENSDSAMSGSSLGPPTLEISIEYNDQGKNSVAKTPSSSVHDGDDDDDPRLLPPQLDMNRDFLGLPPIDNITTIDASAIGISTISSSGNATVKVSCSSTRIDSEEILAEASVDIPETNLETAEPTLSIVEPPLLPYSPQNGSKNHVQTLPSIDTAFNFKAKPASPDSNNFGSEIISRSGVLTHSASPSVSYVAQSTSSTSTTEATSIQNAASAASPTSFGAPYSYPDFSLPQFNNDRPSPTSTSNQVPMLVVPATLPHMPSQLPQPSTNLPSPNFAPMPTSYTSSMSQPPLVSPPSYSFSTSANVSDYPLNQTVMTTAVNNGWKLPIKQISFNSRNSGTKKDGSPRQVKKKRSVVVAQNQQCSSSSPNGRSITKTVCASVSASETESVSEQYIPVENTALCKLSNLVSNTHAKFIDTTTRDSNFQPILTSPATMESNSKLGASSLFIPYSCSSSESGGKLPIHQMPSFWNGKDNKLLGMVPTTHTMPYSLFPLPSSTNLETVSTFPNNGNFCMTYSNCRPPPPLVTYASPSTAQPLLFDPHTSTSNNAKASPPMAMPAVGNLFAPVQSLHPLSSTSPQQLPDSRTLSPENHKDFQGISTQKLGDGIFHTYGIQGTHSLPAQQIIPQSFVSIPPSSYVLPVQSSMIPPTMLPNFILNSKSPDGNSASLNDVRPQFSVNRTMPVYTILPNMPAKIL